MCVGGGEDFDDIACDYRMFDAEDFDAAQCFWTSGAVVDQWYLARDVKATILQCPPVFICGLLRGADVPSKSFNFPCSSEQVPRGGVCRRPRRPPLGYRNHVQHLIAHVFTGFLYISVHFCALLSDGMLQMDSGIPRAARRRRAKHIRSICNLTSQPSLRVVLAGYAERLLATTGR